jgi:acetyl-CoA acetyltransferase
MFSVVQCECAAKNSHAKFKMPITVEEALNSEFADDRVPFRLLRRCLATESGALILVAADRTPQHGRNNPGLTAGAERCPTSFSVALVPTLHR